MTEIAPDKLARIQAKVRARLATPAAPQPTAAAPAIDGDEVTRLEQRIHQVEQSLGAERQAREVVEETVRVSAKAIKKQKDDIAKLASHGGLAKESQDGTDGRSTD
ncbi:MAG: hypothetical protein AAFR16_13325 [Pseudomonadota bacterium]